jgi:hypothetical protein
MVEVADLGQRQTDANPMSNECLINRIEVALELVQTEQAPARALAESIRGNGRALEAMPYNLIKELDSMAMDLDIAQWHDEDGFEPRSLLFSFPFENGCRSCPVIFDATRYCRSKAALGVLFALGGQDGLDKIYS